MLREAARPVLADLAVIGLTPDLREEAHESLSYAVCAWVQGSAWSLGSPDRYGQGIRILLGHSFAERVAGLAAQFQEWTGDRQLQEHYGAVGPEAELRAVWPGCPEHGRRHPLSPVVHEDHAVWSCEESGQLIADIGTLADSTAKRGKRQRGKRR